VEFFVALNYPSYFDFIIIVVLGKTFGSLISYRIANYILSKEEMRQVMINTTSTFYFRAVETQIRDHPYIFCITIKIFFPSIIASIGISLLLPSRSGKQ
jgi:phage shock protein PspC (stress-responsive transcriptional regulator)